MTNTPPIHSKCCWQKNNEKLLEALKTYPVDHPKTEQEPTERSWEEEIARLTTKYHLSGFSKAIVETIKTQREAAYAKGRGAKENITKMKWKAFDEGMEAGKQEGLKRALEIVEKMKNSPFPNLAGISTALEAELSANKQV